MTGVYGFPPSARATAARLIGILLAVFVCSTFLELETL